MTMWEHAVKCHHSVFSGTEEEWRCLECGRCGTNECEANTLEQDKSEVFARELAKVRAYEVDLSKHLDLGDSWRAHGMGINLN